MRQRSSAWRNWWVAARWMLEEVARDKPCRPLDPHSRIWHLDLGPFVLLTRTTV